MTTLKHLEDKFDDVLDSQLKLTKSQDTALSILQQILESLVAGKAEKISFTAYLDDGSLLEEVTSMDMRDDQRVSLSISITDNKGKPASVDGVPVWASSDETVITVMDAGVDGMSAVVTGVAPGTARVVVTADADLGTGVENLTGVLDFNITGGKAAAINVTAGTPEDQ